MCKYCEGSYNQNEYGRQFGKEFEKELSYTDNDFTRENGIVVAIMKKLREYETAEKDGRLVVLPCKVGDTLFVITPDSPIGIETTKCIRLSIDKRGIKIQAPAVHDDWGNAKWNFKPIDFGKKVFLDFEEAKKALRESEESDMNIILDPGAFMPEFAHKTDAGADLRSPVYAVVPASGSAGDVCVSWLIKNGEKASYELYMNDDDCCCDISVPIQFCPKCGRKFE